MFAIYTYIYIYMATIYIYDPGSRFATTPPHGMVPKPAKTRNLQCFLHGGWLARSAILQIRRISATSLQKTCYLQCFGCEIVE